MSSFDDDDVGGGFVGYDPRLQSQRLDSFSNFDPDSVKDSAGDSSPIFGGGESPYAAGDHVFSSHAVPEIPSPPSIYSAVDGGFGISDGPILPPPADLAPEEGFALREWRRLDLRT